MHVKLGKTLLEITNKKFLSLKADCLIYPANDYLWMSSSIASDIKSAAGYKIEQEAMKQAPVKMGKAVISLTENFNYKYVVHAVCMGQDEQIDISSVGISVENALQISKNESCAEIVILPFLTDKHEQSFYEIAEKMLKACIDYCVGQAVIKKVIFTTDDENIFDIYNNALKKIFSR